MGCFTLGFVEQLLIWLVVLIVMIAIIKLVVPAFMSMVGAPPGGGIIARVLMIILWGALAILGIYVFFELFSCLAGSGGAFHGPLLR